MRRRFRVGNYRAIPRAGKFRLYDPDGQYIRHFESPVGCIKFILSKAIREEGVPSAPEKKMPAIADEAVDYREPVFEKPWDTKFEAKVEKQTQGISCPYVRRGN